ncbi:Alpha/beta hydrolase family protein [Acinetobacter stercoris]|uniref:Alpha/beta hydrolase family protein n=2 Tax=Acinetobacter stercoris TaxID=2126983 RepID=A0A2U3MWL4_9GAMM|nr:alpha/beta fold hydrolase [Acinetobacter stercoris]SPL69816.1 Alpha/beta hydrolase family protein [Acinetobacter stercoris]
MTSYKDQQAWKDIQQYLPEKFQLNENNQPGEEWWDWKGNNIHLDTYRNPQAKIKVILFHGVGTNGRQMSLILGHPLAEKGYETIAVDMPTYGLTQVNPKQTIKYDDWVQAGSDLIDAELAKDDRPIVLYGLSAGGMLTYHVAARNRKVKAIVGMTFLDTASKQVKNAVSTSPFMAQVGGFFAKIGSHTPFKNMNIPMKMVSKMDTLVNNPEALKVFLKDKTSAGNSVTVAFLNSYLNYKPQIQPEDFSTCPVLLTQPEHDRWTPLALSEPFLHRIKQVPVEITLLKNAGHYPLEQPGLDQMVDEIDQFYQKVL